jgi:hypothetical protein
VFASGTCKKDETAVSTTPLYRAVIDYWYEKDEGYKQRGPIADIATDGAANFRLAAASMLLSNGPLDAGSTAYGESRLRALLRDLPLFDLDCGEYVICDHSDDKHSAKSLRMLLKSQTRAVKVRHQLITGARLMDCLRRLGEQDLMPLFFPGDRQNVTACVKLYAALDKHKGATEADCVVGGATPALYAEFLKEFKIIAHISSCFHLLLTGSTKSISEHLTSLSKLAHIVLVAYRKQRTKFMAAQTYENIQTMIRAHYKLVAQAKIEEIGEYYIFQDSDDRLENLFGILRTFVAAMRGMDMLMLEERISAASECARIYASRPELDPGSRRLSGSMDHHNPCSWSGCVDVTVVNLRGCWLAGRAEAKLVLMADGLFSDAQCSFDTINQNSTNVTTLKPRGERVVVFPGTAGGAAGGVSSSGSDSDSGGDSDGGGGDGGDGDRPIRREPNAEETKLVGEYYHDEQSKLLYKIVCVKWSWKYMASVSAKHLGTIVAYREVVGRNMKRGDFEGFDLQYTRARIAAELHWDVYEDGPLLGPCPDEQCQAQQEEEEEADAALFREQVDMVLPEHEGSSSALGGHRSHSGFITDVPGEGGKQVHVEHQLKLEFAANTKETERLRRMQSVYKQQRAMQERGEEGEMAAVDAEEELRAGCVVGLMAKCEGRSTKEKRKYMVLVVEVDSCYAGNKEAAGSIRGADMRSEGHFINGRVLLLKAAGGGLQWKPGAYGNAIKGVAAADVRLLSPDVSAAEGGDDKGQGVLYSFPTDAVAGLVHVFDIEASKGRLPAVVSSQCWKVALPQ